MKALLLFLYLAQIVLGTTRSAAADANTRKQIRAVRTSLQSGLDWIRTATEMTTNQHVNGQFSDCISVLRWAIAEHMLFASTTGAELNTRVEQLGDTLSHSEIFTNVFPEVSTLFETMRRNKAAFITNFDATHLGILGRVLDGWLLKLSLSGNTKIQSVLVDLATDSAYSERARVANSFANFLALLGPRTALDAPLAEDIEEYELDLALRGIRRFNHIVLATPNGASVSRYFFSLLGRLQRALLGQPEDLSAFIAEASAKLAYNFTELDTKDMLFFLRQAEKVFLGQQRTRRLVLWSAREIIEASLADRQEATDRFAISFYYTAKSIKPKPLERSSPQESLAEAFLHRFTPVAAPRRYHMSQTFERAMRVMIQRAQEALSQGLLGVLPRKLARFIGLSDQADLNDSLIIELVSIQNRDLQPEDVEGIYYDLPVHRTLRNFFDDINFPSMVMEEYRKASRMDLAAYRAQWKVYESFLGEFMSIGRQARGALLSHIGSRRDYQTEAGVLLRLAEYGLQYHDSKVFAAAVAGAKPGLMGRTCDRVLESMSLDIDDSTLTSSEEEEENNMEEEDSQNTSSRSPNDAHSGDSILDGSSGSFSSDENAARENISKSLSDLVSYSQ